MKILLADDEEIIHLSYNEGLKEGGFDVLNAYDGIETLRIVKEERPDLVILDLMMPGMDGRDICKQIKGSPETEHIKVIMLTAMEEHHDRLLGFELGADEYLTKPYPSDFLITAVRKQLGMKPYMDIN